MALTISVIIPTYNESAQVRTAVTGARRLADEVIVADGGSTDATCELASDAGAMVVTSSKGRGSQLAAGALVASGDVLLFLHADVAMPSEGRDAILRVLESESTVGGNFALRFVPETRAAKFFTWANHVRREWLTIYYGDSAIFVRRDAYLAIGGFAPIPLFEDFHLVQRLERYGRTAYVRNVVVEASARRFERAPARTLVLWSALQAMYSAGVPASRLAKFYRDFRSS